MKYKAVLFDMDGVILDSETLHFAAFKSALKDFGYDLSATDYDTYFAGRTDKDGFISYFEQQDKTIDLSEIMIVKARAFLELATDHMATYPRVTELVKTLSAQVPIALVTGALRTETEVALQKFGIAQDFTAVVTSADISQGKPSPEGYLKAAELLGVSPHDCVILEDSPKGVQAAINAGIDSIAVTNTHSAEELSHAGKVVDKLSLDLF